MPLSQHSIVLLSTQLTTHRKLKTCIKMYSSLIEVYPEALQKLSSMLLHPFLKIQNQVGDTLFSVPEVGKGVSWVKAEKEEPSKVRKQLALASMNCRPSWVFHYAELNPQTFEYSML